MEIKIIPSPLYKDLNGIPAYKSGEWPGIKPNHFERTRLMLKHLRKNLYSDRKLSYKHIPEKKSKEYIFRPSLKLVKSYDENIRKQNRIDKGRKHEFNYFKKIKEAYDNNLFFGSKRRKEKILNNLILPQLNEKPKTRNLYLFRSLSEINLQKEMTRKKRINSLEERRNYFKMVNPGDKNYRYVDCSADFFKGGGLIPGSTNILRKNLNYEKVKNDIYENMNLNIRSLSPEKIYDNKFEKEIIDNDVKYVFDLENWDSMNIKLNEDSNNAEKQNQRNKLKN